MKKTTVLILAAVLAAQAAFYYSKSHAEVIPATPPWAEFPQQIGRWRAVAEIPVDEVVLEELRPDDYMSRTYTREGGTTALNVFIGYFNTQRTGRAPHSPRNCLPGAGWEPMWSESIKIPIPEHGDLNVTQFLVQKNRSKLAVLYWYQSAGWAAGNEYLAQFYAIPELLSHGRTDVALVRVIVPASAEKDSGGFATAIEFTKILYPLVKAHIPPA
ncbi:MAG: EpsI family protein [Bryobacteraceae bacterium]|nr:EpsI family protein [Bryobacteraceae bacterium]